MRLVIRLFYYTNKKMSVGDVLSINVVSVDIANVYSQGLSQGKMEMTRKYIPVYQCGGLFRKINEYLKF